MGWFGGKGRGGKKVVLAAEPVCDCCSADMAAGEGYLLATKEVVVSQGYWESGFAPVREMADPLQIPPAQLLVVFDRMLSMSAGQRSAWSICEKCSELFVFDRARAREYARTGTAPREAGKVKPRSCALFAAAGWERIFGEWPSSVPMPGRHGLCDVCRKQLYAGEITFGVPPERMAGFRAAGHIEEEPQGPSHPGGQGYHLCQTCVARAATRAYRAEEQDGA